MIPAEAINNDREIYLDFYLIWYVIIFGSIANYLEVFILILYPYFWKLFESLLSGNIKKRYFTT